MVVVVMQPTYLPWIGYFDLMDDADVFVLFDTAQFEKQGWQQRNRIKVAESESRWLTVPVVQHLGQKISEVRIDALAPWRRKHWGTIEQYYKHAPYWKAYRDELADIYAGTWESLLELNLAIILFLRNQFGISTKLVRTSQIPVTGDRVRLLANICRHFEADTYLSTVRAADYIEGDNVFPSEGIKLLYHRYEHPMYRQLHGAFLPYMSAIDLLLNEGPDSLGIIRSGRRARDDIRAVDASEAK